jgi:hypothetical protein
LETLTAYPREYHEKLDGYKQRVQSYDFSIIEVRDVPIDVAYRNHSEYARDNPYDMDKAWSILNHVRDFMQPLQKGGLSEQKTGHWT